MEGGRTQEPRRSKAKYKKKTIIGEIERGEGRGADDIRAKDRNSTEHEPDGEGSSHHIVTGR